MMAQHPTLRSPVRASGVPPKRPHLFRVARGAEERLSVGAQLSPEATTRSRNKMGACRGGRNASWGRADGHRSGFAHPRVGASLGAERWGDTLAHWPRWWLRGPWLGPVPWPLVPTLWVAEDLLKRSTVDVTLAPHLRLTAPCVSALDQYHPLRTLHQKNRSETLAKTGKSWRRSHCHGRSPSTAHVTEFTRLRAQASSSQAEFSWPCGNRQGLAGRGARSPPPPAPRPGLDAQGAHVLVYGPEWCDASRGSFQRLAEL